MAESAPKSQATNTGGGDNAARRRQPECMGSVVHISPGTATSDTHCPYHRIDARALHQRQVDDQTIVNDAEAAAVVSATAHRHSEPTCASEIDGADDVCHIAAASDQTRISVDHALIDLPRGGTVGVSGYDQRAAQACFQIL